MIEICLLLLRPIGDSFVREGLREEGVFGEWVEIGVGLIQGAEANMGGLGGSGGAGAVEDMLLGFGNFLVIFRVFGRDDVVAA